MFEARIASGVILKKIVEAIKDLVTDVNLDATPEGISLQAMDSSHVALVSLSLKPNGFSVYKISKPLTLGISISNLAKVMKLAGFDDEISLQAEEDPSFLKITFENKKQDKKTEFNLNLITLDSEHLGIPETNYSSEIVMNSTEFSKLIKELHALSETVTVETTLKYVRFTIEGEVGTGSVEIQTCDQDEKMEGGVKEDEAVIQSFALRYLNMFNKASVLSDSVKLMMAADTPLVVEFEIDKLGELKYYLAPKINEAA